MTTNKDMPLVSIVIPVYGVEKYIERCAKSLFGQTYPNIEYVFVDDCSPDHSIEILQKTGAAFPQRWKTTNVIRNISNLGQAEVRNIGIRHCHGQFMMHVDSDDWLDVDAVTRCVDAQRRSDADLVLFDRRVYRLEGVSAIMAKEASTTEQLTCQILSRQREVSIWGMMIRTSLYKDNGIECKKGINMSEDYQTSTRLAYHARKCAILHDTYYNYEMRNASSISAQFKEKNARQEWVTLDILTEFFSDKPQAYKDALVHGKALLLCYQRHNAAYHKVFAFCDEVEHRIAALPATSLQNLPLPYRIGLKIKNRSLLRRYVALLKSLKRLKQK